VSLTGLRRQSDLVCGQINPLLIPIIIQHQVLVIAIKFSHFASKPVDRQPHCAQAGAHS
jgi:hypothetical protein